VFLKVKAFKDMALCRLVNTHTVVTEASKEPPTSIFRINAVFNVMESYPNDSDRS
jgi:hypothetical protein